MAEPAQSIDGGTAALIALTTSASTPAYGELRAPIAEPQQLWIRGHEGGRLEPAPGSTLVGRPRLDALERLVFAYDREEPAVVQAHEVGVAVIAVGSRRDERGLADMLAARVAPADPGLPPHVPVERARDGPQ